MIAKKGNTSALRSGLGRIVGFTEPQAEQPSGYQRPQSRVGKKSLLTQHDPAVIQQLRLLALQHETTQQKLVAEALNLLFAKYGKPPIAN